MKMIKNFIIAFLLTFFTLNSAVAVNKTARPTAYINTVHAMQLCEQGSTLANCLNPVTIGESSAGKAMDLGVVGSTVNFGSAGLIPSGRTYTHGQVILNRAFTVTGSVDTTASVTCKTGGSDGTISSGGATNNGNAASAQVLYATNGTGNGENVNSTSAISQGIDAAAGTYSAGHDYMKFRWALSKSLNVTVGKIPSMTISFDLSEALEFNDGDDGACNGNDFYPGKPVVTNSFE